MIKLNELKRDIGFPKSDYILEQDKFEKLLPYLYRKITGDWVIVLLSPSPAYIKQLLDVEIVPSYVTLEVFIEQSQLEQILLSKPDRGFESITPWKALQNMIAELDKVIEHKAVSELYRRIGPNVEQLAKALEMLTEKSPTDYITTKDVRLNIPDNSVVYASTVVNAFMLNDRKSWEYLCTYEQNLGNELAFYAIRKYIRKLIVEKQAYLKGDDYKNRIVSRIPALTIIRYFEQFERATSPKQLIPIFMKLEE